MAMMASLRFTTPIPSPRAFPPTKPGPQKLLVARATDTETPKPDPDTPNVDPESPKPDSDEFDNRLSRVRLRYRSGMGKKAEIRKAKKGSSGAGRSGSGIYLPPVPLKEPESEGLKVDFGFSPYSERINGRVAILGLAALVLVELATGKGVINYHSPAIVLIQVYFVAAVSTLYIKYEKEQVSVWPQSSSGKD